jgi:peptidoglycan/LPS O-acetylase OafA/YrhL
LLREQQDNGEISISSFYMRRMLRVWPLYFVITALGFFVLPFLPAFSIPNFAPVVDTNYWRKFILYLFFMPHVEAGIYPSVNYAGVLWSVGVEEWFYIGWPFLLLWMRGHLWLVLPAIVLFFLVGRLEFRNAHALYVLSQVRFDCMAMGAIGAVAYVTRSSLIEAFGRFVASRAAQFATLTVMVAVTLLLKFGVRMEPFSELVF